MNFFRKLLRRITDPLPKPRNLSEIPSPAETQNAMKHLRLAASYYDEAVKHEFVSGIQEKLYQASRSIAHARALDPRVFLEVEGTTGTYKETLDTLAASCFFLESLAHYHGADTIEEEKKAFQLNPDFKLGAGGISSKVNKFDRRRDKAVDNAIRPAELAVEYSPYNTQYRCHLVRVYRKARRKKKAKEALMHAQRLAPDNIEVLRLANE